MRAPTRFTTLSFLGRVLGGGGGGGRVEGEFQNVEHAHDYRYIL